MTAPYVTAPATAKLVRAALKRRFPGVKFSVRTHGSGITVRWMDGPARAQVREVADAYVGGRFDPVIDLGYRIEHYLLPDGSAVEAESGGTVRFGGVDEPFRRFKPHPDAQRVRFGLTSAYCDRTFSRRTVSSALARLAKRWGGFDPAAVTFTVDDADGSVWVHGAGSIEIPAAGARLGELLHQELVDMEALSADTPCRGAA